MNGVRRLIRPGLEHFETLYRHALRLEAVGPVLLLGTGRHASAAIELPDGTRIERGAVIGRLHINNARIAALQASGRHDADPVESEVTAVAQRDVIHGDHSEASARTAGRSVVGRACHVR